MALAAVEGDKTLAELAQQSDVHLNQITQREAQLLDGAADVFGTEKAVSLPVDVKTLHAKIGELTLANEFFRARAQQSRSVAERKAMIDRSHALPLTWQM